MIYDLEMLRTPLLAAAVVAAAAVVPVGWASAEPGDAACEFRLTAPTVIDVSGRAMVTATVEPAGCAVAAEPTQSVVCIAIEGGAGSSPAEQCVTAAGPGTARVEFAPYRPGAVYTATGRGCASVGNPPHSICRTTGPLTAAL